MPSTIKLYNDYLQQPLELNPDNTIELNKLKIYSCGPTVYSYQHIGNVLASFVPTTLKDLAELAGWQVELTINVTDVGHLTGDNLDDADSGEDRMEKAAKVENKSATEIAEYYLKDYRNQLKALNITPPSGIFFPKATEYLKEQLILVLTLLSEQKAYILEDGIYFDSVNNKSAFEILKTFKGLPKSSGDNKFVNRDIKNTTKNPSDFALWKFVEAGNLQKWRISDFVNGGSEHYSDEVALLLADCRDVVEDQVFFEFQDRWGCPGWHTECVAMIARILGRKNVKKRSNFNFGDFQGVTTTDLHLGGIEHLPLHHKNEILQAEALNFNLSSHWMHWQHVLIDGKKMSKSLGNSYLVIGDESITGSESLTQKGFDPLAYRLMMFENHYLQPLNFTWDKLTQSQTRLFNLRKEFAKLTSFFNLKTSALADDKIVNYKVNQILDFGLDNLNFSEMVNQFQELLISTGNSLQESQALDINNYQALLELEKKLLKLDLWQEQIPMEITQIAKARQIVKDQKNYSSSDQMREILSSNGWQIDDYSWGYGLWKKPKYVK